MSDIRLRHAIAFEAARLMYSREESEYFTAKRRAAKRVCRGDVKPSDLPANSEIRELIQTFARTFEGDSRIDNLRQMRVEALKIMRLLCRFRPRLIGSVMTGHIRKGSDIDLHLFADSIDGICQILEAENYHFDVERKQIVKHNESRVFTHIHVRDRFDFELTIYDENKAHYVFKSSITGQAIERASINELEQLLAKEYPDLDLDTVGEEEDQEHADEDELEADPYPMFRMLLEPLDKARQSPKYHPEGDVLYHLLQVFELARRERPWDEEFLQAALLHDIGKGIDPFDHVRAGLDALTGLITPRVEFLIANHMLAHEYRNGTLGHRQKIKLEASEHLEDLLLLQELDRAGRVRGAAVGTVDGALEYLRTLADETRGDEDETDGA